MKQLNTNGDINRLDNTLIKNLVCDSCGKSFTGHVGEIDFVPGKKLVVVGYRCTKCGEPYIIYVADNKLRNGMYLASQYAKAYNKLDKKRINEYKYYEDKNKPVPQELINRWQKKMNEVYTRYLKQKEWNVKRSNKLKAEYLASKK